MLSRVKEWSTHLPPPARNAAASAYGFFLRWRRYGPDSERLVGEALLRDTWDADAWDRWRAPRLEALLDRAATRVPFYREHWARRRADGDTSSWTDLAHWPILEKDSLRRSPEAFVADDVVVRDLMEVGTSGTTGTPLRLWRTRATDRAWYALTEARQRRWYGIDRGDRWAIIGSKPVIPVDRHRPPYWVWNAGLNQLYLSSAHIGRATVPAYLEALAKYRVNHIVAYPTSLYTIAWMAQDLGLTGPPLRIVISNAELLLPRHREAISAVFQGPVQNTYGMAEIVAAANECEHGVMHLWPDAGLVEVLGDDDRPVDRGEVGELVCTGLLNLDMPLIRYRIGDRGALGARVGARCACGRTLPELERIEGRSVDNLIAPDGRRIRTINALVFHGLPIRESQVVQETVNRLDVAIVPDVGFDATSERQIVDRFHRLMGDVDVTVRQVSSIPRSPNGKFRALVSHVGPR